MAVSIIIPNYNHSKFLRERIESVLNQSYQNFEVIILDDCSTDDSKLIIEQYRDHIKVSNIVYNLKNSGSTFKQWENGIRLAKFEWIWIAESDDIAELNFLEVVVSKISNEVNVIFTASNNIDENYDFWGRNTWADDAMGVNRNISYSINGKQVIVDSFFKKNIIPNASAVIFKKKSVDMTIFKIISNMKFAGDWLFWVKLLESGNISYIANTLNNFRHHGGSTRSYKSSIIEYQRFLEYFVVLRYIKDNFSTKWDYKFHDWIFNEMLDKHLLSIGLTVRGLVRILPYQYRLIFIYRLLKLKLTNYKI